MRIRTPVIVVAGTIAWLTSRERNPARWPAMLRDDAEGLLRDAREAVVDGAQAGVRAERAFDSELDEARARAHRF